MEIPVAENDPLNTRKTTTALKINRVSGPLLTSLISVVSRAQEDFLIEGGGTYLATSSRGPPTLQSNPYKKAWQCSYAR